MATDNKINLVVTGIKTALDAALVEADGTGVLKAVERKLINPFKITNPPVLALIVTDFPRSDRIWEADLSMRLRCNLEALPPEAAVVTVIAEINAVLATLNAANGTIPGTIDRPRWSMWYAMNDAGPLTPLGAVGSLRITVEEPLKVTT